MEFKTKEYPKGDEIVINEIMKILHCLKLSLNAFLEMLEKTFCYYDFKKETKDDFFKVNPAKTVEYTTNY